MNKHIIFELVVGLIFVSLGLAFVHATLTHLGGLILGLCLLSRLRQFKAALIQNQAKPFRR